ncbi:MAG: DNA polymerase III subunit epsilon [Betaproteobacteria bacterium]|jgi:DNA polymerase-3 subunit epsilon
MSTRQIILDTETTGLDAALGHRILEVAAVELNDRRLTGNHLHRYINPGRASDDGALQVHGLTEDFLRDKPKFREISAELLDFINGAELVIHNASFDLSFLNHEFALINLKQVKHYCPSVIDTLALARELHPGKRNNLDALCDRYQIDNSKRTLHGALLDANLLAEVYLAMTRGQNSLMIDMAPAPKTAAATRRAAGQLELVVLAPSAEELDAHEKQLAELDKASNGATLWRKLAPDAAAAAKN